MENANLQSIRSGIFIVMIGSFALLSLIGVLHHEIWLDEAHHWLLARDSQNLSALFHNARYEGHPLLWNTLLFFIARISSNVLVMQIVHILISISAVTLFIVYAPFSIKEKCFFILGDFILYEYNVISRNYSLLIFFLFLSILLYKKEKDIGLGVSLSLLANTHLFGLIISSAFVIMKGFEMWTSKEKKITGNTRIGAAIFCIGVCISLVQIIPPSDSTLYHAMEKSSATDRLARTSVVFLKAFIPIPDFNNYRFWNTNLFMTVSKPVCVVLSLLLFCYPFSLFKNQKPLQLFFYNCACIMLLFFYLSDLNATRYYGVIYLVFITCVWLSRSGQELLVVKQTKYESLFFISVLAIQMIGGIMNYTLDVMKPFSESKNVSCFLNANNTKTVYIAGGCGAAPIAAYLNEKIYYLTDQKWGSFCAFNRKDQFAVENTEQSLKTAALKFANKSTLPVYYITHSKLNLSAEEEKFFQLKESFTKSALRNENYLVYQVLDSTAL